MRDNESDKLRAEFFDWLASVDAPEHVRGPVLRAFGFDPFDVGRGSVQPEPQPHGKDVGPRPSETEGKP